MPVFTLRTSLLAAFTGLFLGLAAAPHEIPGGPIAFAPLFALAMSLDPPKDGWSARSGARRGFAIGMVAGTACNAFVLYWVVGLMQSFVSFPLVAALPVGCLLWVGQSGPMALAGAAAGALRGRGVPLLVGLPIALTAGFAHVWQLFPWHPAVGMLPFLPWVQAADLGGQPLLDLILFSAGMLALAAFDTPVGAAPSRRGVRGGMLALSVLLLVAPALYGVPRLESVRAAREAAPQIEVGVVQPNVPISEKYDPRHFRHHLRRLRQQTREMEEAGADVVVWPETAYPYGLPREATEDPVGTLGILRYGVRGPVLVGAATLGDDCEMWNSVLALDADGRFVGRSDKVKILWFGERVPFWDVLPPLQSFFRCPGVYPGDRPRVLELAGAGLGVLNCYEDVLDHYGRVVARDNPDLLVNVTNDAWFGDTSEPHLHHMVARMRSIETRRDLIRAVNTGVSGHVAATGENLLTTETFVETAFVSRAAKLGRSGHAPADIRETVFVRNGPLIDWLAVLALLALAIWGWKRGGPPGGESSGVQDRADEEPDASVA